MTRETAVAGGQAATEPQAPDPTTTPSMIPPLDASEHHHRLVTEDASDQTVLAKPPSEWADMTHEQKLQWAEGFIDQVQSTHRGQSDGSGHACNDAGT